MQRHISIFLLLATIACGRRAKSAQTDRAAAPVVVRIGAEDTILPRGKSTFFNYALFSDGLEQFVVSAVATTDGPMLVLRRAVVPDKGGLFSDHPVRRRIIDAVHVAPISNRQTIALLACRDPSDSVRKNIFAAAPSDSLRDTVRLVGITWTLDRQVGRFAPVATSGWRCIKDLGRT